jgi:hypothetical protein
MGDIRTEFSVLIMNKLLCFLNLFLLLDVSFASHVHQNALRDAIDYLGSPA